MNRVILGGRFVCRILAMFVVVGFTAWVAAQKADEDRAKAEASFKDIYGKEFDKANAGSPKAKVEFAQKLQKAAETVANDPAFKTVILEKAIGLASTTQTGYKTAFELYQAILAIGEDKSTRQYAYIQLLEKMIPLEPAASKQKLILEWTTVCREAAGIQCKKENGLPQPYFEKVKKFNKTYALMAHPETKEIVKEIDKMEKDYEKLQGSAKEYVKLKQAVAKNPEDGAAVLALANYYQTAGLPEEVQLTFANSAVPQLKAIAEVHKRKGPKPAELLKVYLAAALAIKGDTRILWSQCITYQKLICDESGASARAEQYQLLANYLEKQAALETGPAKTRLMEEEIFCEAEVLSSRMSKGEVAESRAALAKLRTLIAANLKPNEMRDCFSLIDFKNKEIEKLTQAQDQAKALEEKIAQDPKDFQSHSALGLHYLQFSKTKEAAPHLVKSDVKELRILGELLLRDKPDPLVLAKAYKDAADQNLPVLKPLAREQYEAALRKEPQSSIAEKIRLILEQIPDDSHKFVFELRKAMGRGPTAIFDGSAKFVELLNTKGQFGGRAILDAEDKVDGSPSLKIVPDQRALMKLPNGPYPIVERPGLGQYRYIQFTWKKTGGQRLALQICRSDKSTAIADDGSWLRYEAGVAALPRAIRLGDSPPAVWKTEIRDLFKDFGEFQLHGICFTANDGMSASFGSVYLSPSSELLRKTPK